MQRYQRNRVGRLLVTVHIRHQRHPFQQSRQAVPRSGGVIFLSQSHKLPQVLQPFLRVFIIALNMRLQPRLRQSQLDQIGCRQLVPHTGQHYQQFPEPGRRRISPGSQRRRARPPPGLAFRQADQGRKQRNALPHRPTAQILHRLAAQAPGRGADRPGQVPFIRRVVQDVEIRQQILDFPPLVKADAADNAILHPGPQTGFLQSPRLGVHPIHHRAAAGRNPLPLQLPYLPNHKGRFLLRGIGFVNDHFPAGRVLRSQILIQPPIVMGNQVDRGLQDSLGRAVILFQGNSAAVRVILLKTHNVPQVGIAPGIDGLIRVAHHAQVLLRPGQQFSQPILGYIGILKLIHHQIPIAALIILPDAGIFPQQLHRPQQQIVKIHRIIARQQFLIVPIDPGRHFRKIIIIQLRLPGQANGVLQQALAFGDDALHRPGIKAFGVNLGQFHCLLDKAELVIGVIDGVVRLQSHALAVAAQQSGAKGVKSAGKNRRARTVPQQTLYPRPHLPSRLVGKGNGGDGIGTDPMRPRQISDAVGNDAGFAAARPGYNQQRPLGMQHRVHLRRVQPVRQFPFGSSPGSHSGDYSTGKRD